jgi:hypothetical protein
MTTTNATPADPPAGGAQRAAAWLRDSALSVAAVLLVLAVAASGWSASFLSLHQFATLHMALTSAQAWFVPGTFDGAALSLSLLAFRAATYGRASLGARLYVYGFTALSSWINYIHITDPRGRLVACLLPISAVIAFDKVLKEAREAFERRNGKQVFRVRPGLLLLRLAIDRANTKAAIKAQITAIPVEALIGLGAGTLARDAVDALNVPAPAPAAVADPQPLALPAPAAPSQLTEPVDSAVDKGADSVDTRAAAAPSTVSLAPKFVPPTVRLDTDEAAERIREGYLNGWSVTDTATYAGRDKAQVSRKFADFTAEGIKGLPQLVANGTGPAPADD